MTTKSKSKSKKAAAVASQLRAAAAAAAVAAQLRAAAAEMEKRGSIRLNVDGWIGCYIEEEFTCNLVDFGVQPASASRRSEYSYLFGMDSDAAQNELWNISKRDPELTTRDLRVLMLGFAAAMVETGDLPA